MKNHNCKSLFFSNFSQNAKEFLYWFNILEQKLLKAKLAARHKKAHQRRKAEKNKNKEECEIDPIEAKESGFFIKANHITFETGLETYI